MKTRAIGMCEMVTQPNQCFLMAKAERPFPWLQLLQVSDLPTSLVLYLFVFSGNIWAWLMTTEFIFNLVHHFLSLIGTGRLLGRALSRQALVLAQAHHQGPAQSPIVVQDQGERHEVHHQLERLVPQHVLAEEVVVLPAAPPLEAEVVVLLQCGEEVRLGVQYGGNRFGSFVQSCGLPFSFPTSAVWFLVVTLMCDCTLGEQNWRNYGKWPAHPSLSTVTMFPRTRVLLDWQCFVHWWWKYNLCFRIFSWKVHTCWCLLNPQWWFHTHSSSSVHKDEKPVLSVSTLFFTVHLKLGWVERILCCTS